MFAPGVRILAFAGIVLYAETGELPSAKPGCDCYVYKKTLDLFELKSEVNGKFKGWRRKIYDASSTPFENFLRKALSEGSFEKAGQNNSAGKALEFTITAELLGAKVPAFGKSITATMQCHATLQRTKGAALFDRTFEAASKAPFGGVPADIRAARAMDGAMAGLAAQVVAEVERAIAQEALK